MRNVQRIHINNEMNEACTHGTEIIENTRSDQVIQVNCPWRKTQGKYALFSCISRLLLQLQGVSVVCVLCNSALRTLPGLRGRVYIICLLFERRHLLPTLKNALLFACAQMGGFGLGEQVVRVNVILFIGLSPPSNTNEFNPELLVISCRGGMSAYPFGLQTLSQRTFASYRRCRKTRRREGRLKSSRSEPALA